jgi:hypothetical protein
MNTAQMPYNGENALHGRQSPKSKSDLANVFKEFQRSLKIGRIAAKSYIREILA